ncbi:hypothetical protein SBOR_0777 [Sclerotinia borealis F-4128]|uniref:BZIP domain-containing protein n=1 Tax=Sclerotinia borealis (strain F-4128) TaxID=1432307 RepID=W9CRY4_SCLBF|nr:hypothetical protein SBOR_0777 [Sclerotinia borealis F-4128]
MASQLQFIEPAGTTTTSIIQSVSSGQYGSSKSIAAGLRSLRDQNSEPIIQSTGQSTTTSAFTNRFNPSAQLSQHQNPYVSAIPSQRPRPQVPLFSQSTGSVPRTPNMALQGNLAHAHSHAPFRNDSHLHADMDLFDEFTAFEGGASTQNSYSSAYSSPAVATMYDPINNLSSSSSFNMGTVSPQDLSLRDSFASAPNSAAFTNLTSPSTFNESPAYDHDYESPYISHDALQEQTKDHIAIQGDPWFSLFPEDDAPVELPNVDNSPLLVEEELEVADQLNEKKDRHRRSGSAILSPSATSGIRKSREKALSPIIVENPSDLKAMKRARNTLAARKSRQRKMQRFEELEDQIAKLTAEREHWKSLALKRNA